MNRMDHDRYASHARGQPGENAGLGAVCVHYVVLPSAKHTYQRRESDGVQDWIDLASEARHKLRLDSLGACLGNERSFGALGWPQDKIRGEATAALMLGNRRQGVLLRTPDDQTSDYVGDTRPFLRVCRRRMDR